MMASASRVPASARVALPGGKGIVRHYLGNPRSCTDRLRVSIDGWRLTTDSRDVYFDKKGRARSAAQARAKIGRKIYSLGAEADEEPLLARIAVRAGPVDKGSASDRAG